MYAKQDFKTWDGSQIEKVHLQRYLKVNNKASNIACRAELGRFPLNITINQKILKYILYIQSKDEESFVKQAFLMSFDLNCNGKNSFHSHLMNMSEYFKLPDFNPDLLDIATCMVKSYVSSMNQEYISYWQNTLQHFQKLEFYRSFKTDQLPCTKKNGHGLQQTTTGYNFVSKPTIEKLKKIFQTPEHSKKCAFLAKCVENALLREKYCQQNRGK